MVERRVVTGNFAAAYGALLSRVDLIAAYPITPQTFVVEHASEFVNNGMLDAEFNDGINLLGHEFYHIRSDAKLPFPHQGFTT